MYNGEGKSYSFDPKGLIHLSHEAWRPENRELIKHSCPGGNMILHFWCAHQFLYKSGTPGAQVSEAERWDMLRAWYGHMRAVQQFVDLPEMASCLPRSSFPFGEESFWDFSNWTYKAIGNSTMGEEPRLLFNSVTGLIHIPSFGYSGPLVHSRRKINPKNKVCIPLKDASCWPLTAQWQIDSCSLCCDPNKGPNGDSSCWGRPDERGVPRSYDRCCQTDFRNVMCEEIRKSTPGCLDCPQSLSFFCEEAHRFRAVKAWQAMNETWYEYLEEQNKSRDFRSEILGNTSLVSDREIPFFKLIPQIVELEAQYYADAKIASGEYRSILSRVNQDNATLDWLKREVREPVYKNYTAVKKDLDKLTSKFKASNTSLWDHLSKEQREKDRKTFLTEKLCNYSREIPQLETELEKFNDDDFFQPIFAESNVSHALLVHANATVHAAQLEMDQVHGELGKRELDMFEKETIFGLAELRTKLNRTNDSLKSVLNEFNQAKKLKEEMETRKRDCELSSLFDSKALEKIGSQMIDLENLIAEIASKRSFFDVHQEGILHACNHAVKSKTRSLDRIQNSKLVCVRHDGGNRLNKKFARDQIRLFGRRAQNRSIALLLYRSFLQNRIHQLLESLPLPNWVVGIVQMFPFFWTELSFLLSELEAKIPTDLDERIAYLRSDEVSLNQILIDLKKAANALVKRRIFIAKEKLNQALFGYSRNEYFQFSILFHKLDCDSVFESNAFSDSFREYLEVIQTELDSVKKREESEARAYKEFEGRSARCKLFSQKELKKHSRNVDRIEPVVTRLELQVSNLTQSLALSECGDCEKVRNEIKDLKLELQRRAEIFSSARTIQLAEINRFRSVNDQINTLNKRREFLDKTLREAHEMRPKMDAELEIKDQVIFNITKKQDELRATLIELEPLVGNQSVNFTLWESALSAIDKDVETVNISLWENLVKLPSIPNVLKNLTVQYEDFFSILNETFYNLTFAQESLSNSTIRISQLVEEFKQKEQTYFEKEEELKIYSAKVEKGEIPRVDFKFDY